MPEDDTWIHGRGACDTKGSLAAMLAACEQFIQAGAGGLALLLVVAETERRLREIVGDRAAIEVGLVNEPQEIFVPEDGEGVVVGFNTGIPFLPRLGRPVLFGPGSILDAHSDREKIRKADLLAAVGTYRDLVVKLGAVAG